MNFGLVRNLPSEGALQSIQSVLQAFRTQVAVTTPSTAWVHATKYILLDGIETLFYIVFVHPNLPPGER